MDPASDTHTLSDRLSQLLRPWQQFWFTPAAPQTLAVIRILGGAMLLYTHLIWGKSLVAFLGPHAWIDRELAHSLNSPWSWSYLYYIDSPALLWTQHLLALAVFAMLTLGLFTRVTSILAALITLSYCHRLTGLQFGLDQVNAMLAMYLAIGPCGDVYSLDRWLAERRGNAAPPVISVWTNISIRLIQIHLCIIYLFGGVSKLRGVTWWDGSAIWYSFANYEYQSIDMTWLGHFPIVIALMTHVTIFWETFYCVLIWPRATRPWFLAMAVAVHAGIGFCLGMITFGGAMIIANVAFIPPEIVQRILNWRPSATRDATSTTHAAHDAGRDGNLSWMNGRAGHKCRVGQARDKALIFGPLVCERRPTMLAA